MPSVQQREAILKLILKQAASESSSHRGSLTVDHQLAEVPHSQWVC